MPVKLDISDATVVPFKCLLHAHLPAAVVLDTHVVVDQNLHNTVTHSVEVLGSILFFYFFSSLSTIQSIPKSIFTRLVGSVLNTLGKLLLKT